MGVLNHFESLEYKNETVKKSVHRPADKKPRLLLGWASVYRNAPELRCDMGVSRYDRLLVCFYRFLQNHHLLNEVLQHYR